MLRGPLLGTSGHSYAHIIFVGHRWYPKIWYLIIFKGEGPCMAEMLIRHNGAPTTYPRQKETMIDVSRSQVTHMDPFLV